METRSLYLAAYDVCDPRRLRAALELVKGYSTGGQKSVHECFLTEGEKAHLLHDMALVLEEDEDSFLLLRLDPRARVLTLGKAIEVVEASYDGREERQSASPTRTSPWAYRLDSAASRCCRPWRCRRRSRRSARRRRPRR